MKINIFILIFQQCNLPFFFSFKKMDQEILQRVVQNLLQFRNLLIGVLNDENLPQMEKFLTVLILANDMVDNKNSN